MRPDAENFDGSIFFQNLVNETMLEIDPTGISARKVSHKPFIWRWIPKGVLSKNSQKCFCVRAKT